MREALELLLPRRCVGCSLPGVGCCSQCRADLAAARPTLCWPDPCPPHMPSTWSASVYEGTVRTLIVAFKDQDRGDAISVLRPVLARTLRVALAESPAWTHAFRECGRAWAVPVPSRSAGTRRRGRFPVADLVRSVLGSAPGRRSDLRQANALAFVPGVADQAGLDHVERARNMAHSMRVKARHVEALTGRPVVLVDDIVTTGNTLAEAARVVHEVGAGPVLAITVAATHRQLRSLA